MEWGVSSHFCEAFCGSSLAQLFKYQHNCSKPQFLNWVFISKFVASSRFAPPHSDPIPPLSPPLQFLNRRETRVCWLMVTVICSGLAQFGSLQRLGCSVPYPRMLLWMQSPWINHISAQQNLNCMIRFSISPVRSVALFLTTFHCTCFGVFVSQDRPLSRRDGDT